MTRLGNIDSVLEPVNSFLGKVGQPIIGDYVQNITRARRQSQKCTNDMPLCLTSMPHTIPLVDKSSMTAEQQDQLTQSLKYKLLTFAPQGITPTIAT